MTRTVLITGGAGFIGSAVLRLLFAETDWTLVNLDKLTYAANPAALAVFADHPRYCFERADICDRAAVDAILSRYQPAAVLHLAAESHVDRSIDAPSIFIDTNVGGTCTLLAAVTAYWRGLAPSAREAFRFHHVSTDEVFGALGPGDPPFTEDTPYRPNSPYAASKAASDHFVRAWHHTYGLPVVTSNCSNNYGPWQFPEKLIPLIILNALEGRSLPVYGTGDNIRDWLHVEDHARALRCVLERGQPGRSYAVGGRAERSNLSVVQTICDLVDDRAPHLPNGLPRRALIGFVADRPGHDFRYAIDPIRVETELGWRPRYSFQSGLAQTIDWYLSETSWWQAIRAGVYSGGRLGLTPATTPQ